MPIPVEAEPEVPVRHAIRQQMEPARATPAEVRMLAVNLSDHQTHRWIPHFRHRRPQGHRIPTPGRKRIAEGTTSTLSGPITDTFHSEGIPSTATGFDSQFRKLGSGTLTITSDNSSTFNGQFRALGGITVLGDANALGTYGSSINEFQMDVSFFDASIELEMEDITGIEVGDLVSGEGIAEGTLVVGLFPDFEPPFVEISLETTAEGDAQALTFSRADVAGTTEVNKITSGVKITGDGGAQIQGSNTPQLNTGTFDLNGHLGLLHPRLGNERRR